jgi:hypothetical protein
MPRSYLNPDGEYQYRAVVTWHHPARNVYGFNAEAYDFTSIHGPYQSAGTARAAISNSLNDVNRYRKGDEKVTAEVHVERVMPTWEAAPPKGH